MRIPLNVYNKDSFYESWDLGSTMWVVDGNDGIRVFQREKFDDRKIINSFITLH